MTFPYIVQRNFRQRVPIRFDVMRSKLRFDL